MGLTASRPFTVITNQFVHPLLMSLFPLLPVGEGEKPG